MRDSEVAELLGFPAELLDTSLDQLRTLAVVHATGSAQRAARVLQRSQSSVQKQLDTLNDAAVRLMGEALVAKQGRGKDFLFTSSGDEVVALATGTLRAWTERVHGARRRVGSTITVGTTEFTVEFLGQVWPELRDTFNAEASSSRSSTSGPVTSRPSWTPSRSISCAVRSPPNTTAVRTCRTISSSGTGNASPC
ncbi:LysR family transcriptional regulator [Streptomyces sp. MN03-5084-2B]|nr:LysR family transcriptional regulator [Streptomyces sp. MN03-5084-2B]